MKKLKVISSFIAVLIVFSLLVPALFLGSALAVESYDTEWEKSYGGDEAYCVHQTSDGGYIMGGRGNNNAYLVKTGAEGNLEWQKDYGPSGNSHAISVQQTQDGGYIFCGSPNSQDALLTKTDSEGNIVWQKTYGGSGMDSAFSVLLLPDGGYIFCGSTQSFGAGGSDVYLVRTDSEGTLLWQKTYGGSGEDSGGFLQKVDAGGYVILATTTSFGPSDKVYLLRVNDEGSLLWQKHYPGGANPFDYISCVNQTSDGGFILCGPLIAAPGPSDASLLRTDADGNLLWRKAYDWSGYDSAGSVLQTPDGGFLVCGYALFSSTFDAYLLKTDAEGNVLLQKKIIRDNADYFISMDQTTDGGYVLCGATMSFGAPGTDRGAWLIKIHGEELNTPQGTDVEVNIEGGITTNFAQVDQAGNTTATPTEDPEAANFQIYEGSCYDISTTATFMGKILISFPYDESKLPPEITEQDLKLLHEENGEWVDVTKSLDTENNIITGEVDSLSRFAIAWPLKKPTTLSLAPQSVQYSDTISATLAEEGGGSLAGKTVSFKLAGKTKTAVTDQDGKAFLKIEKPKGTYSLTVEFAGDEDYKPCSASSVLEVTKEDATLTYTGPCLKKTGEPVILSAEVAQNDSSPGDITKAPVLFELTDAQGKKRTIAANTNLPSGVAQADPITDLPANVYEVKTLLADNSFYKADGVTGELAVYNPRGGFTSGAGSFSENGTRKTFGFSLKYSWLAPLLPQGYFCLTDWTSLWNPVKIEARDFVWLVIPDGQNYAYAAGNCSYKNQNGYTFFLVVQDDGALWWSNDCLHLIVENSAGDTVYEAQGKVSFGGGIVVGH